MIKKITMFLVLLLAIFANNNCGTYMQANAPMRGVQGPDLEGKLFMQVHRSESFSSVIGPKSGESCQRQIIGLIAWGDTSIPNLKKKGGISTIDHLSFERTVVLNLFPFLPIPPLYSNVCVTAYGN